MHDIGFKFFLGVWDPDYTSRTMSAESYNDILLNLDGEVRETLLAGIHEHRDSCLALGYNGLPTGGSKVQRRHCCAARKTQPMPPGCAIGTRGGCWGDGGCRNIEEFVRSGECMVCLKLKAWEVSQFGKKDVECKPDRNRPADLTWNRKPHRNQTTEVTRDRKPDRSKPSFSGTIHDPTTIM